MIEIFSDGGSNPRTNQAAGWAFVIKPTAHLGGSQWKVFMGHLPPPSTNNIAELLGVTNALKLLWAFSGKGKRTIPPVRIYSDSQYTLKSVLEWRSKWEYQGFPEKNVELLKDLFRIYDLVSSICEVELKWVKGHAGVEGNELADKWATAAKNDSNFLIENDKISVKKVVGSFDEFIGI